jgi:hypothetical protein
VLLLHFYPDLPFVSAVWSGEKRFEDFLQKEGLATRPLENELMKLWRHARRRFAEVGREQGFALGRRQGHESERRVDHPGRAENPRLGPRPAGHDQHERLVGETVDDRLEELDRGRVGPVEVLDGEDERASPEPPLYQAAHHRKIWRPAAGLDVAEAVGGLTPRTYRGGRDRGCLSLRRPAPPGPRPASAGDVSEYRAPPRTLPGRRRRRTAARREGANGVTHGHRPEPPAAFQRREPFLSRRDFTTPASPVRLTTAPGR